VLERTLIHEGWVRDDTRTSHAQPWSAVRAYGRGDRSFAIGIIRADERARLVARDDRFGSYTTVYTTVVR
jgi:hypothetical protein